MFCFVSTIFSIEKERNASWACAIENFNMPYFSISGTWNSWLMCAVEVSLPLIIFERSSLYTLAMEVHDFCSWIHRFQVMIVFLIWGLLWSSLCIPVCYRGGRKQMHSYQSRNSIKVFTSRTSGHHWRQQAFFKVPVFGSWNKLMVPSKPANNFWQRDSYAISAADSLTRVCCQC